MRTSMPMIWDFSLVLARRLMLWAGLSVLAGVLLIIVQAPQTWTGTFWGGFGLQAVLWGAIDAAIAVFGIHSTRKSIGQSAEEGPEAVEARAQKDATRLRRLLWVNTALDVLYVAGGLGWALTRGAEDPFASGTGWGIVVQGAFLFVFDLLHARAVPSGIQATPALNLFKGPEHRPFLLEGGIPAAILVHGFGGTPAEMRGLGEMLHASGWTIRGVLLPGFGPDIETLPERHYSEWTASVEDAAKALRDVGHAPLMLIGYSMGSTVSLAAAERVRPDGIALVAPFWWQEKTWMRVIGEILRPFLPSSFRPLSRANFDDPRLREGISKFLPGADLDDPEVRESLRHLRFPLHVVEQVRDVSMAAYAGAAHVTTPALMIQGRTDPVVRILATKKLAGKFPDGVYYVEVDGGHDLVQVDSPTWGAVSQAVLEFSESTKAA